MDQEDNIINKKKKRKVNSNDSSAEQQHNTQDGKKPREDREEGEYELSMISDAKVKKGNVTVEPVVDKPKSDVANDHLPPRTKGSPQNTDNGDGDNGDGSGGCGGETTDISMGVCSCECFGDVT